MHQPSLSAELNRHTGTALFSPHIPSHQRLLLFFQMSQTPKAQKIIHKPYIRTFFSCPVLHSDLHHKWRWWNKGSNSKPKECYWFSCFEGENESQRKIFRFWDPVVCLFISHDVLCSWLFYLSWPNAAVFLTSCCAVARGFFWDSCWLFCLVTRLVQAKGQECTAKLQNDLNTFFIFSSSYFFVSLFFSSASRCQQVAVFMSVFNIHSPDSFKALVHLEMEGINGYSTNSSKNRFSNKRSLYVCSSEKRYGNSEVCEYCGSRNKNNNWQYCT